MPSARTRLSSFALVLGGLFASAYAVGEQLPGHDHGDESSSTHGHITETGDETGTDMDMDAGPASGSSTGAMVHLLLVPGEMIPVELPEPATMVHLDDLIVIRDGLHFTIDPVDGLEPYLGQAAHLVAFREGDLAYVHLHPDSDVLGDVRFSGTLPGPGRYRLFFQFVSDGIVMTAPFTVIEP